MNFKKLFSDCFNTDFDVAKRNFVQSLTAHDKSHSEIYFENSNSFLLEYVNGVFITDSTSSQSGFSERSIEKESVSFSAKSISGLYDIKNSPSVIRPFNPVSLTNKKRKNILIKAEAKILPKNSSIDGLALKWQTNDKFITLLNSKEFYNFRIESLAALSINLKIKKHGTFYEGKSAFSAVNEKMAFTVDRIAGLIESALSDAENKSNSVVVEPGSFDVVFDSGFGGLVFHELVGHLLEADYVTNQNTLFKNCIGQKIADGQITILDACLNDGIVNYKFDDDGVEAGKTVLVENGILKNYISDQYHEEVHNITSTGNGRRQSYKDLPLPRMTNTMVLKGTFSQQEILESVKKGLFVTDPGDGTVNTLTGDFTFANVEGFILENGKPTKPFHGIEFSGNVKDTLNNIKMIGDDFRMADVHADCIKENQILPVGFGSPYLKIKNIYVR
ncbi:MAG: TldD/PmbA family protein [Calditrichaeota bacterium]|nr:MAG: TldD/PmbA family protein [Calditrichota bacterium]MBL1203950.1 TldD/PmbA family protein [Calditrichota bacterium]NOG43781.1 TldD/PmbA family protein [Calditrichota bacterium]